VVEDDVQGAESSDVPTIASLLTAYRDRTGASYEEMSRRSGHVLSVARLQQLATTPPREFPKKTRTVAALAILLEVPESTIVLGFARSLGIPIRSTMPTLAVSLPPGTDDLMPEDRDAILAVVRQLVAARSAARPPEPPAPIGGPDLPKTQGWRLSETQPLRVVPSHDQAR
jgi:hypothetical protein